MLLLALCDLGFAPWKHVDGREHGRGGSQSGVLSKVKGHENTGENEYVANGDVSSSDAVFFTDQSQERSSTPTDELKKFDPFLGKYNVSGDFANLQWAGTLELKRVVKGWLSSR